MADKKTQEKTIIITIVEILYSALAVAWFLFPLLKIDGNILSPYKYVSYLLVTKNDHFLVTQILYLFYLVPVISAFKVVMLPLRFVLPFLGKPNRVIPSFLNVLSSLLVVAFYIHYIFLFAENLDFLLNLDYIIYIIFATSLIINLGFFIYFIKQMEKLSKTYREYLIYQRELDKEMTTSKVKNKRKKGKVLISIQQKLMLSFIILILIIIISLSYFILTDYRITLLDTVEDTGILLASQSANYYKINFHDEVSIETYISKAKYDNELSKFQFDSLTFYQIQSQSNNYLARFSTSPDIIRQELPAEEMETYQKSDRGIEYYNAAEKTFGFGIPVSVGSKLIGYSVVKYQEEIIYAPFFQALLRVILITSLYVYISIFFVMIFGDMIVFPLLFLRMNVMQIGLVLLKMTHGEVKKSPALLTYDDKVRTRDEIRALSVEFQEMVTVIRGIIPYISTST
ncbi:MAG: hypothetical protein MJB14_00545, partial [Spirochaetes bacterium]|nr:hypothetical protein [Spirochaetota bacterium]